MADAKYSLSFILRSSATTVDVDDLDEDAAKKIMDGFVAGLAITFSVEGPTTCFVIKASEIAAIRMKRWNP